LGFAVVLMRYALGVGSIWLQESILYAHSALFLLAAAWTLKDGGHVRVDVFYADAAPATGPGSTCSARSFCCYRFASPFCISPCRMSRAPSRSSSARARHPVCPGVSPEGAHPAVRAAAGVAGRGANRAGRWRF